MMDKMPLTAASRRAELLVAAAAGFAAVFGLAMWIDDPRQAITVLYVVPIALVALATGVRAGVVAALLASALVAVWVAVGDVEIGMSGWISRLVAFFLIALLVGRYEQLARETVRQRLEERAAAEVQEGVVQSLVIATYELRRGDSSAAESAVEDALGAAKEIISARLPDVKPGDLRLSAPTDELRGR
jgi:hypothetical protein